MTNKQRDLINDMLEVLDTEFNFGRLGKKKDYSTKEAYKLISLNKTDFFGIIDEGQCTVKQYNELTRIAGRTPKLPRHLISNTQAIEWIEKYTRKVS